MLKKQNMRDNKEVLLLWFIGFFNKKIPNSGANNAIKQNEQLDKELHKPVIRKFKKKESLFSIQRQYLGCWSYRYAINKQT